MNRTSLVIAAVMLAGAGLTSLGSMDREVNFDSVRELWADILRDADQAGLQATRVSDSEEIQLGRQLAPGVNWARPDPAWQPYVDAIGAKVAAGRLRKGIPYTFLVIDQPIQNAFALPGGQIFIFRGMLESLQSEAEVAAILGHEIAHVDLRHCVERYQYQLRMKRIGAAPIGQIADFTRSLAALGYQSFQELEADSDGLRLSIDAGYDPAAGPEVFRRMYLEALARQGQRRDPNTPLEELAQASLGALTGYFQSHPANVTRMRQLDAMVARNRLVLAGRSFYRGVQNHNTRTPRTQAEFPNEFVPF